MVTHKEIRSFFYREDMIETTDFLLKRYEPTNLSKLDILRVIYPVIKDNYSQIMSSEKMDFNILKKSDDAIRRHIFPLSYTKDTSSSKLYEKWKNGDSKAFEKLIEKNFHLPSLILSNLKYDSPFDEDLFQLGLIKLIKNIKKYNNPAPKYITSYLNGYLTRMYLSKIKEYDIEENNKDKDFTFIKSNIPIFYYKDSEDYSYDNITDYDNVIKLKVIKNFIVRTPYLSFLEKTILMAKLALIGDIEISTRKLSDYFSCSYQNIDGIYHNTLSKIEKLKNFDNYYTLYIDYLKTDYSLFNYFLSDKRIVLNCMKNLKNEELELLKHVWGDDFSSLRCFESINLNRKQVILYYKTIIKIYNNIKEFMIKLKNYKAKDQNEKKDSDNIIPNVFININCDMPFLQMRLIIDDHLKNNINLNDIFRKLSLNNEVIDYLFFEVNNDIEQIASSTNLEAKKVENILEENKNIKQYLINVINSIDGFIVCSNEEKGQAFIKK